MGMPAEDALSTATATCTQCPADPNSREVVMALCFGKQPIPAGTNRDK